jgi:putative oxidoreductase
MNTTVAVNVNPLVPLAARILIAALFLTAGIRKALAYAATVAYMTRLGFPAPEAMAVISIIIEIGGALLLIAGWRTRWVAWGMALFTVIATFAGHRFWQVEAAQYVNQMNHFLKNFAIVGGLLMIAGFGPGPTSVDKR